MCGVPSPLVPRIAILGTPLWAASCSALLRYRELSGVVHSEFSMNSSVIHCFCLPCVCRHYQGDTEVSEPRAGEECRQFVEDLERRTAHAKGLLDEIERQHPEAERQDLLFTTLTAGQLENKLDRTEIPQVAA